MFKHWRKGFPFLHMTQCSCISNAGEDVLNQSSFLFRSSPDGAFPPLRRGTEEAGPIGSLSVGSLPAPSPHRQVSRRGSAPVDRPEGGRQVFAFLLRHKTRKGSFWGLFSCQDHRVKTGTFRMPSHISVFSCAHFQLSGQRPDQGGD